MQLEDEDSSVDICPTATTTTNKLQTSVTPSTTEVPPNKRQKFMFQRSLETVFQTPIQPESQIEEEEKTETIFSLVSQDECRTEKNNIGDKTKSPMDEKRRNLNTREEAIVEDTTEIVNDKTDQFLSAFRSGVQDSEQTYTFEDGKDERMRLGEFSMMEKSMEMTNIYGIGILDACSECEDDKTDVAFNNHVLSIDESDHENENRSPIQNFNQMEETCNETMELTNFGEQEHSILSETQIAPTTNRSYEQIDLEKSDQNANITSIDSSTHQTVKASGIDNVSCVEDDDEKTDVILNLISFDPQVPNELENSNNSSLSGSPIPFNAQKTPFETEPETNFQESSGRGSSQPLLTLQGKFHATERSQPIGAFQMSSTSIQCLATSNDAENGPVYKDIPGGSNVSWEIGIFHELDDSLLFSSPLISRQRRSFDHRHDSSPPRSALSCSSSTATSISDCMSDPVMKKDLLRNSPIEPFMRDFQPENEKIVNCKVSIVSKGSLNIEDVRKKDEQNNGTDITVEGGTDTLYENVLSDIFEKKELEPPKETTNTPLLVGSPKFDPVQPLTISAGHSNDDFDFVVSNPQQLQYDNISSNSDIVNSGDSTTDFLEKVPEESADVNVADVIAGLGAIENESADRNSKADPNEMQDNLEAAPVPVNSAGGSPVSSVSSSSTQLSDQLSFETSFTLTEQDVIFSPGCQIGSIDQGREWTGVDKSIQEATDQPTDTKSSESGLNQDATPLLSKYRSNLLSAFEMPRQKLLRASMNAYGSDMEPSSAHKLQVYSKRLSDRQPLGNLTPVTPRSTPRPQRDALSTVTVPEFLQKADISFDAHPGRRSRLFSSRTPQSLVTPVASRRTSSLRKSKNILRLTPKVISRMTTSKAENWFSRVLEDDSLREVPYRLETL